MSPKQPSKEKRAAQNRNQRAARAARAANAKAASTSPRSAATSGGGGFFSRLRGTGAPRTVPGSRMTVAEVRSLQPPGLRAALSAVFAAVAAILLTTFALRYPVDARGDVYTGPTLVADWVTTTIDAATEQPDATAAELADSIEDWAPGRERDTVVVALWPYSAAVVLPLGGAGIALWAVRRRSPSRQVNRALYATLFGAILTQGLLMLFLPTVIAVGVAMFQVRKAETMAAAEAAADGGARDDARDDDVIDVDEVDDAEPVAPDEVDAD